MVEVNVDKLCIHLSRRLCLMRWKLPTCPGMNVPEYRKGNIIQ